MPKGRPSLRRFADRLCRRLAARAAAMLLIAPLIGLAAPPLRAQQGDTVTLDGFAAPESVLIDAERGVIYVSNVNGAPGAEDGNGFISRIRLDDMSVERRWIDGAADGITLNAPKGMAVTPGGFLLVSDIDVLRAFVIETGEPSARLDVPDAVFLNDLHMEGGTLYVTDSGSDAIAGRLLTVSENGTITVVSDDASLSGPNGVTVAGTGGPVVATMRGDRLVTVGEDGAADTLATLPAGGLDGLVPMADGGFLVSSWQGEAVYRVARDGTVSTLHDGMPSPADIDADEGLGLLAVPLMTADRVVILPLDAGTAETADQAAPDGAGEPAPPQ